MIGELTAQAQFQLLAAQWKRDSLYLSSIPDMIALPSYQEIIRMGEAAVPLLLAELQRQPDQWFAALRAITGADPVPVEARGRLDTMAAAWLAWGRERGYCW